MTDQTPMPRIDDAAAIDAYARTGVPLDRLPYTPEFDRLHDRYARAAGPVERDALWRRLCGLRKSGALPRLGRVEVEQEPPRRPVPGRDA